jgi:P27 family predicted phage terminase small subunit
MSPGPPPKPPSRRIRKTTKSIGVVRSAAIAPRMPRGLCQRAQQAWQAFWGDVASGAMRPADTIVAVRWISDLDRYFRLVAQADREPIVTGSQGQIRANPLYDTAFKLQSAINDAERRIGISPLDRLRLGVALSESAKSLADLNAEATNVENDPRATLTVVADDSP